MKIILDTNVLISGIFFKGPPHLILLAWRDNGLKLIASEDIFQEYSDVCERLREKYPGIEFKEIIDLIAVNTDFYQPKKLTSRFLPIRMMINSLHAPWQPMLKPS